MTDLIKKTSEVLKKMKEKTEEVSTFLFYSLAGFLVIMGVFFTLKIIFYLIVLIRNLFLDKKNLLNFNFMSNNCYFKPKYIENFKNIEGFVNNEVITYDRNTKEMIKTLHGIPIKYMNKYLKKYVDLNICDFYWPSSYKTYLSGSIKKSKPSLKAIEDALNLYKVRTIHLDVFSSSRIFGKKNAIPVVKEKSMYSRFYELDFHKCLETINNNCWKGTKLPLILYLDFKFEGFDEIYNKIYYSIMKIFTNHILDKKYSFSGRGGLFPAGQIKMKDAIDKIIIITNKYPTRTRLDEIINGNTSENNSFININKYTEDEKEYGGLSINQSKEILINNFRTNLEFIYSESDNKSNPIFKTKTDLANPDFIDASNFGVQFVMMSLYLPDKYLTTWVDYFKKNKNQIVLKFESLRFIKKNEGIVDLQNPLLSYKTKNYNLPVSGFFSTEKSGVTAP